VSAVRFRPSAPSHPPADLHLPRDFFTKLLPHGCAVAICSYEIPSGENPQTLDRVWEVASDDASVAPLTDDPRSFDPDTPSHVHAECTIAAHRVHIDATAARLWALAEAGSKSESSWMASLPAAEGPAAALSEQGWEATCPLGSTHLLVVDDARQAERRGFSAAALRSRVELLRT
jgi:hypothetical protein